MTDADHCEHGWTWGQCCPKPWPSADRTAFTHGLDLLDDPAVIPTAVPDGHTVIGGKLFRLERHGDLNRYGLVPSPPPGEPDEGERLHRHLGGGMTPRRFVLVRHEDETGVSTEQGAQPGQVVAWGVTFPDGVTVTRWCVSEIRQTAVFASIEDVEAIHGHGGKTQVEWMD